MFGDTRTHWYALPERPSDCTETANLSQPHAASAAVPVSGMLSTGDASPCRSRSASSPAGGRGWQEPPGGRALGSATAPSAHTAHVKTRGADESGSRLPEASRTSGAPGGGCTISPPVMPMRSGLRCTVTCATFEAERPVAVSVACTWNVYVSPGGSRYGASTRVAQSLATSASRAVCEGHCHR